MNKHSENCHHKDEDCMKYGLMELKENVRAQADLEKLMKTVRTYSGTTCSQKSKASSDSSPVPYDFDTEKNALCII